MMRIEVLALAVLVGAATWVFRSLPMRFDLSGLRPEGGLSRLLAATGPAAIAALFVASILPSVAGGQGLPFWGGSAAVIALWFWRRSVVLATLGGALAFGLLSLV